MSAPQLAMTSRGTDDPLLLEKVSVRGCIHSSLARITMEQRYRNQKDSNVEAIYTFPLPPSAVLLRTVVTLGGKRYEGVVMAKAKAEAKYEEAVAGGDTAIMVERPEPGIYTMNIGNLMAGESASVEIEYAQPLDWSHGRLRLALPMTIAPRYGEERSALAPHAKPHIDMLTERAFDLELRVATDGKVHSPSHQLSTRAEGGGLLVSLARNSAWMDRDFVMVVQSAAVPAPFAVVAKAGESQVGFVSFQVPELPPAGGRDVRIVVDCSGSMEGESIALARAGAINLLHRLRAEDRFALVAFGSTHVSFQPKLVEATEKQVEDAVAWVQGLHADLGGTELASALAATMELPGAKGSADIFLVTDGQVGESAATVERARALGHRVFVIGIGVSPSRGMLEGIAEATRGAIDYVGRGEDVADAIGRQFARVTQEPLSELSIEWGAGVDGAWRTGADATRAFSGDTIRAFADVRSSPRSMRVSYVAGGKRTAFEVPVAIAPTELADDVLHRLAGNARIREGLATRTMEPGAAEALALQHQLVTQFTNYVLVIDRGEERAEGMPVTTPVKTMLAEGWGGAGRYDSVMLGSSRSFAAMSIDCMSLSIDDDKDFFETVNDRFGSLVSAEALPMTLAGLESLGLPDSIAQHLRKLIAAGKPEEVVVRAFWVAVVAWLESKAERGLVRKAIEASKAADNALVQVILKKLRE